MNSLGNSFRFCRVCLIPEDEVKFVSIFADGGKTAFNIHKLVGVKFFDVESSIPSLICTKCIRDIDTVEKLKLRIQDADEYYCMMTAHTEKSLLGDNLMNIKLEEEAKKIEFRRLSIGKKAPMLRALLMEGVENINPRKRARDESSAALETPAKKAKQAIASATPKKLGIHRMIIKNKRQNSNRPIETYFEPLLETPPAKKKTKNDKKKKKKAFAPKLMFGSKKKSAAKKSTFECDSCKETFTSYKDLNVHLESHGFDEPFSCEEILDVHQKARHEEEEEKVVTDPLGADLKGEVTVLPIVSILKTMSTLVKGTN